MEIGSQITVPPIPHGSLTEKVIVGRVVNDLLAAGYLLDVYDGEETTVTKSTDPAVIFEALASTDTDTLYVYKEGSKTSFVLLVWGNDHEIISDYGVSLEGVLAGANALAESLAEG